jgi:glycosyltransferase involved in cell wall biosynthesis
MHEILPISDRKLVALITNHGYAGPTPPIGNAPDTGGQNVYVNDLADTLEKVGYEVFIFTRGGFPKYKSDQVRLGEEWMSPHIRYVYLPGGPEHFIRKEEISAVLGEEIENLYEYINRLGVKIGKKAWDVFEFINTHYWDAGVIGYELVERWQADFIFEQIYAVFGNALRKEVVDAYHKERHIRAVRHNWQYLLGRLILKSYDVHIPIEATPTEIHKLCMTALEQMNSRLGAYSLTLLSRLQRAHWPIFTINKTTIASVALGHLMAEYLAAIDALRPADIFRLNRHFWTPHSLGPIKERNFIDYPWRIKKELRFVERKHQERVVCERTPLIVSTSEAISKTLVSHFNVHPDRIIYFPPCVNQDFKPRSKEKCSAAYSYLAGKSGLDEETLKSSKIIIEASRADQTKRKDLILQAFGDMADDVPDSYLFLFGGPSNDVFADLSRYLDETPRLKGRAFLIPETLDFDLLVQIFSLANLYVSASEMEGFGMSVLQAAASGIPIVSSNFIPYTTMYLRGIASIAETQTPEAYAQAMIRALYRSPDETARRSELLVKAAADFSWSVRVKDLHTAEHEPTIIYAENQLDDYVIRLGDQAAADLLVSAAHLHRGRFIEESIKPSPPISIADPLD